MWIYSDSTDRAKGDLYDVVINDKYVIKNKDDIFYKSMINEVIK